MARRGWYNESARHSLAARGIRTGRKVSSHSRYPSKYAVRKEDVQTMSKKQFEREYIWGHEVPGLTHYAYQAEPYSPDAAHNIMLDILRRTDWIEVSEVGPILHMKDGTVLYANDSNDYPQPSDEPIDAYIDETGEWVEAEDDHDGDDDDEYDDYDEQDDDESFSSPSKSWAGPLRTDTGSVYYACRQRGMSHDEAVRYVYENAPWEMRAEFPEQIPLEPAVLGRGGKGELPPRIKSD